MEEECRSAKAKGMEADLMSGRGDIHCRTILRAAKEEGTFALKVKSWCAMATKVDKAGTNWRCPSQLGAPEDRDPGKDWAGGIRLSADRESF